jgi:hypothetical protein
MESNDPGPFSTENLPPIPPPMTAQQAQSALSPSNYSNSTPKKTRPGCWRLGLAFVTILGALVLLLIMILAVTAAGSTTGPRHDLPTILFFGGLELIGLLGGILSFTSIKKIGPIICGIFWLLILLIAGFIYLVATSIQY